MNLVITVICATLRLSRCAFCDGVIHSWEGVHDPISEHRHHFPFCPFVLGQNVGNIPLGEETGPQNIPEKEDQVEEDRETVTNSEAVGQTEELRGAMASREARDSVRPAQRLLLQRDA